MGLETATLVALGLGAAGAGTGAYIARDTAKQTDRINAQGIRDQASKQREIDDRINKEVQTVAKSDPRDAAGKSTDQFLSALRRTRGAASGAGIPGGSDRFADDSAAVGDDVAAYGADVAGTLGRINAPTLQRQAEGQGFARLASDIGATARRASGDQYLNSLRLRGVRPNQGLQLFSQLAGGAAGGIAASSGSSGDLTGAAARPGTPAYNRINGLRG
jgi:hypothetical protein